MKNPFNSLVLYYKRFLNNSMLPQTSNGFNATPLNATIFLSYIQEENHMKYTTDQKRELVLRYQNGESIADISTQTGIARSTLYSWLKSYQTIITDAGTVITPKEFLTLKKRVKKLEGIIQVLKSVDCTVSSPSTSDRLVTSAETVIFPPLSILSEESFTGLTANSE